MKMKIGIGRKNKLTMKPSIAQMVERKTVEGYKKIKISLGRWFESACSEFFFCFSIFVFVFLFRN